jgi:ankyrin repeat protein
MASITSFDHQLLSTQAYLNQGAQIPAPRRTRATRDHFEPISERPESEDSSTVAVSNPEPPNENTDQEKCEGVSEESSRRDRLPAHDSPTPACSTPISPPKQLRIVIPNEQSGHSTPAERSAISEPSSALHRTRSILRTPVGYESLSREDAYQMQPRSADTLPSSSKLWNVLKRKASRQTSLKSFRKQSSPTSGDSSTPKYRAAYPALDFVDQFNSIKLTSQDGLKECPLVHSAQFGIVQRVLNQLQQEIDIEQIHVPSGRTALAVAAHCGHEETVLQLLRHRANIKCIDNTRKTPLHLAAERGHAQVVLLLLQQRADIEAQDHSGKAPLRLACDGGHVEVARLLLEHRARANARDNDRATALHSAAQIGNLNLVCLLKEFEADVDAKDKFLMSAIHYAAECNHDDILQELVHKRNINLRGKESLTPLDFAASNGSTQTVKMLLKLGADARSKGENGMMAFHWASLNGWPDVLDCLLQKKVLIDTKTSNGKTPLHLAVQSRNFSTAEFLIRKGAYLESFCQEALRPLHYACKADDADMIKLLLGSGVRIQPPAKAEKYWPLQTAIAASSAHAVQILLEQGASPTDWDGNRDRPLCLAARYGRLDIVQMLLDHGAKIDHRDGWDWTPLAYAAFYGQPEIVQLLLETGARPSRDLDLSCGWESDSQGSFRMGFSMGHHIDEKRRSSVLLLLNDASRSDIPTGLPDALVEMDSRQEVQEMTSNGETTQLRMSATVLNPTWEFQEQFLPIIEDLYEDPNEPLPASSAARAGPSGPPPPTSHLRHRLQAQNGPLNGIGPTSQAKHGPKYIATARKHPSVSRNAFASPGSQGPSPISPSHNLETFFSSDMVCDLCRLHGHDVPNLRDCPGCRVIFLQSVHEQGITERSQPDLAMPRHPPPESGNQPSATGPPLAPETMPQGKVAMPAGVSKKKFIAELAADDLKELESTSPPRVELMGDLRALAKAY